MTKGLIQACRDGRLEDVKRKIMKGTDVNYPRQSGPDAGYTPLMSAAVAGHVDVVDFLLNNGAKTTRTTDEGLNALMLAAREGRVKCVQRLVEGGMDVNAVTSVGWTALHYAVTRTPHLEVINLLLTIGASPRIKAIDGKLPIDVIKKGVPEAEEVHRRLSKY